MNPTNLKDLWKSTLLILKNKIPKTELLTWFYPSILAFLDEEKGKAIVGVPSIFFADSLNAKFLDIIAKSLEEATGLIDIKVSVDVMSEVTKTHKLVTNIPKLTNESLNTKAQREVYLAEGVESKLINPKYTLENFVVGAENELAYAAAQAVAKKPGKRYNPLFIYGGVGLGKTHLLQAIGNSVIQNNPKFKVCYCTSEHITNEIVNAIRSFKGNKFREKYRQVDLLIIDDIQFIAHKERTQEEFFHTFNDLHENGKQIILSSDRPPQELDQIEPRLRSRFEWGMIADIQFPNFETRVAILQQKAKDSGLFIDNEVFEFIAQNVHHSIRELEGVLNQAIAQYELKNITPTVQSIAALMKKTHKRQTLIGIPRNSSEIEFDQEKTPEEVITTICDHYKISERQVKSDSRKKHVMITRQLIMYFLKEVYDLTFEEIGNLFGGKEHSTVMHSYRKVKTLMSENPKIKKEVNTLQGII